MSRAWFAVCVALAGCASAPVAAPPRPPPPEAPLPELPASSAPSAPVAPPADAESVPLPTVLVRHRAASGLSAVAVHRALDVTHVRVVVRGAGLAVDAAASTLLAAEANARFARDPLPHAGAVAVDARADAMIVSFASTDPRATLAALGPQLASLGKVVPPLPLHAGSLREIAMFRALYKLPTSVHPYAELSPSARPSQRELARFAATRIVAESVSIVAVGPVTPRELVDALEPAFAKTKPAPAVPRPTPPIGPDAWRFFVIDTRRETASVLVGLLTLDRSDEAWPELTLAVRATETALLPHDPALSVTLLPLRDGACPMLVAWDGSFDGVADTVKQVLDALPPSRALTLPPPLVDGTTRALARDHAMLVGQPSRLVDHLAELAALGRDEPPIAPVLPAKPRLAISLAEQPPSAPVVVVEADAAKVVDALAVLGDVTVLDPRRGLAPSRVVSQRSRPGVATR